MRPEDAPFLLELYGASRADELDQVTWAPGQREAFLRMQHDIQTAQYRAAYPDGAFWVVEVAGRAAGRLTLARWPDRIHVVDLALLPEVRGQGIGSTLLRDVLDEAAATGRGVSLHVEVTNLRAARLYERLGFTDAGQRGIHRLLEWRPTSGEGGLVARPVAAGAERHEEEREGAEAGMAQLAGALAERGLSWAGEDQGELVAGRAVGGGAAELPAQGRLGEHEGHLRAVRQHQHERVAHEPGEVVEVPPRSHVPSLGERR
ncbi:GNAT family N-acetyltransferase [Nocardioides daeguensis]|uniref:GNAT family N-acetyltransferase n=1 Tax=Nocardioides daeguensis TaxID=908359 RepID=UPI001C45B7CB|nr:GNAT family N-acetyltransferase [Nocardioides daeguensis]MBV6727455.1 GNAT family N-acetyltransferase [Nocardioides daeguensis]MCR1773323.1 GNAT family N-acetyltransferase [Nocardioides daeguensis]